MDLYDVLHNRRTIHSFRPDPLPEGAIDRALAAAIMAPNHRLTWPWRFTRIGPETRGLLADLAVQCKQKPDQPISDAIESKTRAKILNPAELIVVSMVIHNDPAIAREDYAATACAIQNIQLALAAEGVGTKWSSGTITRDAGTYRLIGIDPTREEIVGFVWAGIAAITPKTPCRPPLDDFLRSLP